MKILKILLLSVCVSVLVGCQDDPSNSKNQTVYQAYDQGLKGVSTRDVTHQHACETGDTKCQDAYVKGMQDQLNSDEAPQQ
jgi:hypothetical protein